MIRYQYISERKTDYSAKISSPSEVLPLLRRYKKLKQEAFIVITLDAAHQVIAIRMVSIGTLDRTIVHPREVFINAISDRSAGIIVAHNHPSGECKPSENDLNLTKKIVNGGKFLDISVLDHIILSSDSYLSFADTGFI